MNGFIIFFMGLTVLSTNPNASAQSKSPYPVQETPSPLSPDDAARTMRVPEGFQVHVFASEPDVQQPIGFCIDDRGRLWVAEAYNYPNHGTTPGDRIIILEDRDGDGRFDNRKVFHDQLNYVTGIEVGFGGVWVMSPPYFYFLPDKDQDDRPDGPPQVLLDGFGNHANSHNLANGFAWGPDGWLYGTHGRTNWSMIGKPGTPDSERARFDGGVYRYHPVRHVWEPFADGTTNPWGIDWDEYGEPFVCNCVNPHLFHIIRGAHYEPWRNRESSRYAYERIATIADHLHFIGEKNVWQGLGSPEEDQAGGGHAHCGTMIYLGDSWPAKYRNSIFMNNIHGHRINNDTLRRVGSGYIASHAPDLMVSRDPWYMGVTLIYGPDGSVFASDWSDTGECHSVTNTQRQTGRIYKITYGSPKPILVDLQKETNERLVELQLHPNEWFVRHARRILQERAVAGHSMTDVARALRQIYRTEPNLARRLRALWTLHVIGAADESFLHDQLGSADAEIQAWAVRLLTERLPVSDTTAEQFTILAASASSPLVRLYLASAMQQLTLEQNWEVAARLTAHGEDAQDANLPLMIWYGIEPLVRDDLGRFLDLTCGSPIPILRRLGARRALATDASDAAMMLLLEHLASSSSDATRSDLLAGMLQALQGQRSLELPQSWPATYASLRRSSDLAVQRQAVELALIFNDPEAYRLLREQATDKNESAEQRSHAIDALVARHAKSLVPLLLQLTADPATQRAAIRGLAAYDASEIAPTLLDLYPSLPKEVQQEVLQTLTARPAWAIALLDRIDANQISRADLTAYTIRQISSLKNDSIAARVKELWGETQETPADRKAMIAEFKQRLTSDMLAKADLSAGRVVFQAQCANCHRLYDTGGDIGPNITGSQRYNLDYLLENIIDPNAAVARDYQMQVLELESGRIITGLVLEETDRTMTIQTLNEKLTLAKSEIDQRENARVSMMPDGLLQTLSPEQVRNLFGYLMGSRQVPIDR